MRYEVTATRKRPQSFNELVGQEFIVSTLTNSIKLERIAHAYLFSGPRGVGKTSAARILAKAFNCKNGPTENPCGKCDICLEIQKGNSLDVIEIDGASNTSVNDIREIKDEVLFPPNSSRYKIYIIDEVHMLSNSAFNALLKTIEEPPPYIIFIFATTEIHKVPATIRSRCQQYNFKLISVEQIKDMLEEICKEMDIKAEAGALFWIAKEATGSLRDAYTLFDQIAVFSDKTMTLEIIRQKLGLIGLDQINDIAEDMVAGNAEKVIEKADEVLSRGVSVEQFIIDLTEYFRNILFIKHHIHRESILGYTIDRFSNKVIEGFSTVQIEEGIELLLQLYRNIRFSLNQRFELELLLSRLSALYEYITPGQILGKIKKIRSELSAEEFPLQNCSSFTEKEEVMPDIQDNKKEPFQKDKIIAALRKERLTLASALEKAVKWELKEDLLLITFSTKYSADCVKTDSKILSGKVNELLGKNIKIVVETVDSGELGKTAGDKEVELVKKVFRGEIVKGE